MSAPTFAPIDPDLPGLLKCLQQQLALGDTTASAATCAAIGADRLLAASTVVGALCLGGVGFAQALVAHGPEAPDAEACTARVVDALMGLLEPPADAAPDHEHRVAQWLIDGFGLDGQADALLDLVRAEFLIEQGPLTELPEAVLGAMRHQHWALALRGLERLRQGLGDGTPRNTYGLAAMCLHRLGRLDEADQWAREGLGEQQQLIEISPVHSEKALLRSWGKQRTPVISIICTTYNHERYIESTIRGFLSQHCSYPFEILIHDDASTDGTQRVIRAWQARYPTLIKPVLQVVNQKSQGIRPFETLLARAQGQYVAICEGDDFWIDRRKLQKQVGFLMQHPDVSCSAHNYYHYIETSLTVRPWSKIGRDFFVSPRQLMATQMLLWYPTLVFRKTFSKLPPERDLAAFGDQFLASYLGTLGRCAYFETLLGAVRRENEFSTWSPLPEAEKERRRVKTWVAMLRLHERLGNTQAVDDLTLKIKASKLDATLKAAILSASASASASASDAALAAPADAGDALGAVPLPDLADVADVADVAVSD
jgi:glycosyltransferase involved in cell wall biosynthesis